MNKHFENLAKKYPELDFILDYENDLLSSIEDFKTFGEEFTQSENEYREVTTFLKDEGTRSLAIQNYKESMGVAQIIIEECKENFWFFIREILQIPKNLPSDNVRAIVDMDTREEGDTSYQIHPWEVAYAWAYLHRYPIYIEGFRGMNKTQIQVAIFLYERIKNHTEETKLPGIYDTTPGNLLLFYASYDKIVEATTSKFPFLKPILYNFESESNNYGMKISNTLHVSGSGVACNRYNFVEMKVSPSSGLIRREKLFPYGIGRCTYLRDFTLPKFSDEWFKNRGVFEDFDFTLMQLDNCTVDTEDPNALYGIYQAFHRKNIDRCFIGIIEEKDIFQSELQNKKESIRTSAFTPVDLSKIRGFETFDYDFHMLAFIYKASITNECDSGAEKAEKILETYRKLL